MKDDSLLQLRVLCLGFFQDGGVTAVARDGTQVNQVAAAQA